MKSQTVKLSISGMNCQACATRIEKVLNKHPAIEKATVNFASENANVSYDAKAISLNDIETIISKAGFRAEATNLNQPGRIQQFPVDWHLLAIWLIALPFLFNMFAMFTKQSQWTLPYWLQFGLSSIVQLFLTIPIYRSAIQSIKGHLANMDVLIALGTLSIWLFSSIMYFFNDHPEAYLYFEANIMIIAMIGAGKYLEKRAKHQSLNNLSHLLALLPETAMVSSNEAWKPTPYEKIKIGDLVQSTQGEKICADGIVASGMAWLNESHLTGEALPVEKKAGDKVLAGSIIANGSIAYRVLKLGQETLLGDMVQALDEAQSTKASIAKIADKVAGIFVPTVIALAILTFILTYLLSSNFSQALIHAVSVLVIACPCALGLATPASIMVGMGVASKHGIWFKNAAEMEASASIDSVVLDKTGTLTEGHPVISDIWLNSNSRLSEDELLQIAASIEQHSTHPLARCMVEALDQQKLSLMTADNIHHTAGAGLEGDIAEIGHVKVGSLNYCELSLPDTLDPVWNISIVISVSINEEAVGAFALSDPLKNDSQIAINIMKQNGISPYLMSGDQQSVVDYIASMTGIAAVKAKGNLSPRDKANKISELIQQGHKVAMVGDGINDALALATANVGIAMGNGTDLAKQTAGITLMQHTIKDVANALYVGQQTMRNIKQNLFLSSIYNILSIPLAAFGLLTPVIAGLAMSLSSVSVIINALRLRHLKLL